MRLLPALLVLGSAVTAQTSGTVLARLYSETSAAVPDATVQSLLAKLRPDGSFNDLSYASASSATHLARLKQLGQAYNWAGGSYYQSPSLRDSAFAVLGFWLDTDYQDSNWWWNKIGFQQALWPGTVQLQAVLAAQNPLLLQRALQYLARSWQYAQSNSSMQGANLAWLAGIHLVEGAIAGSDAIVAEAAQTFFSLVEPQTVVKEGIQVDRSFHQHVSNGDQLYNGGYGVGLVRESAQAASLLAGTPAAFPSTALDALERALLDGSRWMIRGQVFDYNAQGREIARFSVDTKAGSLLPAIGDMLAAGATRASELSALRSEIQSGRPVPGQALEGNRCFWESDLMTHHRAGWYASARMVSRRTARSESGNGEGLKSRHMGDGVQIVIRSGNEYKGLLPAWDWDRIPGVTAEQDGLVRPENDWGVRGQNDFVGGASDETLGVAAMDFRHDAVSARKAWFFFPGEIVALGAGIQAPTAAQPVYTSLNQARLAGTVTARDATGLITLGAGQSQVLGAASWAHHDDVGYVFLGSNDPVTARTVAQSGDWRAINSTYASQIVTDNVFSLWIDHGPRPGAAAYAYAIVPDTGVAAMDPWAASPPVQVLANTSALQAVRHAALEVAQLVFYQAGSVQAAPELSVAAAAPAVVLIRRTGVARYALTVADPTQLLSQVSLTLTYQPQTGSPVSRTLAVTLPGGDFAGRSVPATALF